MAFNSFKELDKFTKNSFLVINCYQTTIAFVQTNLPYFLETKPFLDLTSSLHLFCQPTQSIQKRLDRK